MLPDGSFASIHASGMIVLQPSRPVLSSPSSSSSPDLCRILRPDGSYTRLSCDGAASILGWSGCMRVRDTAGNWTSISLDGVRKAVNQESNLPPLRCAKLIDVSCNAEAIEREDGLVAVAYLSSGQHITQHIDGTRVVGSGCDNVTYACAHYPTVGTRHGGVVVICGDYEVEYSRASMAVKVTRTKTREEIAVLSHSAPAMVNVYSDAVNGPKDGKGGKVFIDWKLASIKAVYGEQEWGLDSNGSRVTQPIDPPPVQGIWIVVDAQGQAWEMHAKEELDSFIKDSIGVRGRHGEFDSADGCVTHTVVTPVLHVSPFPSYLFTSPPVLPVADPAPHPHPRGKRSDMVCPFTPSSFSSPTFSPTIVTDTDSLDDTTVILPPGLRPHIIPDSPRSTVVYRYWVVHPPLDSTALTSVQEVIDKPGYLPPILTPLCLHTPVDSDVRLR